ncbi:MAG: HAD family hydrolase, partial [Betaproteobacteria bacterium]|nr:HAD family hydrolase [Betaproteobacteria bacterium]
SHHGFRKPDSRLFSMALDKLSLEPSEVIGVGNDMFRDIHGAKLLGIRSIFIDSNQGTKTFKDVAPDYRATQLDDILRGVAALS